MAVLNTDRMEQRVAGIVREAAEQAILPRFRQLLETEVEEKSPGELVTIADREAEVLISRQLLDLLPGSSVVGEEAAAANPSLLNGVGAGSVWLVDPLDGTSNFVQGRPEFAVLVALLQDGETVASWQFSPATGALHTARKGAGAFVDGVRIYTTDARPLDQCRGAILTRFLPDAFKARVQQWSADVSEVLPGAKCAGIDYPNVATGDQDFVLFWRLLPWDHAAGILFLEEAGGFARYFDGARYDPTSTRTGLLASRTEANWDEIHASLIAGFAA